MPARVWFTACMLVASLVPLLPLATGHKTATQAALTEPAWPTSFAGRPLMRLPLRSVEQHFAAQFPGRIGRFSDGQSNIIVRLVDRPTRLLHSAADCFRGIGYQVGGAQVRQDADGVQWSCFQAERAGQQRRVCERIYDAQGGAWT